MPFALATVVSDVEMIDKAIKVMVAIVRLLLDSNIVNSFDGFC